MPAQNNEQLKVFYCYARKDKDLRDELDNHLSTFKRKYSFTSWFDGEIVPGTKWKREVKVQLDSARLILLLISADFLASDYGYSVEMTLALERHATGSAHVIPIILRPADWEDAPFGELQVLPNDGKPVTTWDNRDEAYQDIVRGIRKAVRELSNLPTTNALGQTGALATPSLHTPQAPEEQPAIPVLTDLSPLSEPPSQPPTPLVSISSSPQTQELFPLLVQGKPEMLDLHEKHTPIPPHRPTEALTTNDLAYESTKIGVTQPAGKSSLLKNPVLLAVLALLLITSMAGGSYVWAVNTSHPVATVTAVTHNEATPTINNGIGVTLVEGEYIGISDGQDALDVAGRVPGVVTLMQEASKSLRNGNTDGAQKKWQEAHEKDTRYAEPLIYAENQRVKDSHRPYITIVLGVSLSDKGDGFSRDVLQGAYIAQRECNEDPQQSLSGGKMLRLLIAKSGSRPERSKDIAQQIVRAATSDGTIVGVQGWTTSQTTLEVVDILAAAHLPIVASDTDSDELTRKSPYFFRIGTPSSVYASLIAKYIEKNLASQRLVIFRDPKEPYSLSLSDALVNQFADDRYQRPIIRGFTTADKDNAGFAQQVQKVLTTDKPNLIYIATNDVNHVTALLNAIPPTQEYADLKVFAGGAGYELVQAETSFTGYTRMIISSSAFPDEWSLVASGKPQPPFFQDYAVAYDPLSQHFGSYTYSRANGAVMMDYDAVRVLLEASKIAIQAGKQNPTHNDIKNSLSQINALRPFQGITGAIKFGSDGNPIDKGRFILRVVDGGFLKVVAYQGCFLVGSPCDNENIQFWPAQ